MTHDDPHLSDQILLLAADGELKTRQQNEVRRHLQSCWTCRRRMAEVERTISDFVDGYHTLLDPQLPPEFGAEARLRTHLANQSATTATQGWIVWSEQLGRRGLPTLAALTLLFALTAGAYLWHHRTRNFTVEQMISTLKAETTPNPSLTPGEATGVSMSDVCQAHTQAQNGQVPEALREAVFSEYGMKDAPRDAYEVDFLITPELGGSASIRNLWPEPYFSRGWNAHAKDALEKRLHTLVCSGDLDLSTAQHEIATNWVDAYKKYVGSNNPM